MRTIGFLLLAAAAGCNSAAAAEWVIEAHYPDQATLARGAALFQHVSVDAARHTFRVDTDDEGIVALQDAGLRVSIDVIESARLHAFQQQMEEALLSGVQQRTPTGYPSIPGFACYRTVEGSYQTMDNLVAASPQLAEIHEIGPSWQKSNLSGGYEMRALRITNLTRAVADPERPKMVMFGSIHAREYTPAELLTRMAEWLVAGYGIDPQATWLVDHVDFRFILQANPDGRKRAETGIMWRKNTNNSNGSCSSNNHGVDLNRNFPFHWNVTGGAGSSGYRCDATYRGPSASSEPETKNLMRYVAGVPGLDGVYAGGVLEDRRPDAVSVPAPQDYAGLFFDIHSYSELVLWPWGDTSNAPPNRIGLETLGRRLAWFNGYTPQQADTLYSTDGTTDNTFYGALGVPAYTMELGTTFFQSCAAFETVIYPDNLKALQYAARAASAPYDLPSGPDVYSIDVSPVQQGAGGPYVTLTATIDDLRYQHSNGTQPTYAINAANAFLDIPPGAAGATAIPLSASDGSFNSKTELVEGSINLTGLAPGRHLIYVQGVNTFAGGAGTAGTPDAVFIEVPPAPITDRIFANGFETGTGLGGN